MPINTTNSRITGKIARISYVSIPTLPLIQSTILYNQKSNKSSNINVLKAYLFAQNTYSYSYTIRNNNTFITILLSKSIQSSLKITVQVHLVFNEICIYNVYATLSCERIYPEQRKVSVIILGKEIFIYRVKSHL